MTETNPQIALPKFFDADPELKRKAQEYLAGLSEDEKRRRLDAVTRFMSGELTWAEIRNIPRTLLKELAKFAYNEFKRGDFRKAEVLFKGLSVIDHTNWYYRAALGAVYQKQGLTEQAVVEYDAALSLNPEEATSLVNRGQCHLKLGDREAAIADFDAVARLPLKPDDPWLKRARALKEAAARAHAEKGQP